MRSLFLLKRFSYQFRPLNVYRESRILDTSVIMSRFFRLHLWVSTSGLLALLLRDWHGFGVNEVYQLLGSLNLRFNSIVH